MGLREKIITMFTARKEMGLHFTTKHTGKMEGMYSLSTSCLCNKYCQAYSKDPEKICSKCYAITMVGKKYEKMKPLLEHNTKLLTESVLSDEQIPLINAVYFRFEAFGELNNETQVINYFNICKKNSATNFGLWTKNPWIIAKTIEAGNKKPKNLRIVRSSPYKNIVADLDEYDFVDKVFTVYTKDYIKKNDVEINCGKKKCLQCLKCYKKNSIKYISEKVK